MAETPTVTRPIAAEAAEDRLIDAGLSPALAADVVGEAVVHALPFSTPRNLKKLIRAALARRIPVTTALGPGARTIAVIGGGGSGKTTAIVHLASAYAAAGADVAVIALRGDGDLAHRLQPLGVGVIAAEDAAQARERLGARTPLVTLIDTPATGPEPRRPARQGAGRRPEGAGRHRGPPRTAGDAQLGRGRRGRRRARRARPDARRTDPLRRDRAARRAARAGAPRGPAALVRVLARGGDAG